MTCRSSSCSWSVSGPKASELAPPAMRSLHASARGSGIRVRYVSNDAITSSLKRIISPFTRACSTGSSRYSGIVRSPATTTRNSWAFSSASSKDQGGPTGATAGTLGSLPARRNPEVTMNESGRISRSSSSEGRVTGSSGSLSASQRSSSMGRG